MAGAEGAGAGTRAGFDQTQTNGPENLAGVAGDRQMAGLDLLRFIAAVMVAMFHFGFWFSYTGDGAVPASPGLSAATWWGWIGVQIFFVISGFVIALSAETRTAGAFIRSRILRLMPALYVFGFLSFAVLVIYQGVPVGEGLVLLAKSLVLFPVGPWVDGVYWSLTVEIVFYAAIALLLAFGVFGALGGIVKAGAAASLVLAALILLADAGAFAPALEHAIASVRDAYWSRFLLISTAPYFITGLCLYFLRRDGVRKDWLAVLVAAIVASEVQIYHWGVREMPQMAAGATAFVPGAIFALAVLAMLAVTRGAMNGANMSGGARRTVRALGLASYPLYLVHFVTGHMIYAELLRQGAPQWPAMAMAIGLCVTVSIVFSMYGEARLRSKLAAAYDAAAAALWTLTLARRARPRVSAAE